jgi:hypothetical protein
LKENVFDIGNVKKSVLEVIKIGPRGEIYE